MAFQPEKDKTLKVWQSQETGLLVSINQYGDGEPKIQIGPRAYTTKDGKELQRKSGRLSMEDIIWLHENIDEIKEELSKLTKPE